MKTGIVDVGGGLRGIYAAGIFDRCQKEDIHFDLGIGVSAGSANIITFLAGQPSRSYRFYTNYAFRREYMGARNLFRKHSYLDLDYIYSTLSNSSGEDPLDFDAVMRDPAEFLIVACNALTGETRYFRKNELAQDDYAPLKASSAIPIVCRPCRVGSALYFDGALGDPVPVEKAFSMGCDKVVLILTRPLDDRRSSAKDEKMASLLQREYPLAAERLRGRAGLYNAGVELARQYEKEGRLLIIAPDSTCGVDTLTRDRWALKRLYGKGYRDGAQIRAFLAE